MKKKKEKKKPEWTTGCLIAMAAGTIWFVHRCLTIFERTGLEPSTLIVSLFGLVTSEAVILWRIWAKKRDTNVDHNDLIDGENSDIQIEDLDAMNADGSDSGGQG